jgi:hypothetical protein
MDPISCAGICGSIIVTITKTVQTLSNIRDKFTDADVTIRLLITELSTVKAALSQIQDWAKYNSSDSPKQHELVGAFNISLDGCKIAMEALQEEIFELVGERGMTNTMRAKVVWREESIRGHSDRLRSQTSALMLLIQAVHW